MQHQIIDSLVIALDIGGTNVRGEVLRWTGEEFEGPLYSGHTPTPTAHENEDQGNEVVAAIIAVVNQILDHMTPADRAALVAVGTGVPGIIDSSRGLVHLAVNLGWKDRNLGSELEAALGLPVVLCHDTSSAGLAEQRFGAGRGASNMISIFLGTGIAGTTVVDGKLVTGGRMESGFRQPAGEFGHMPIVPDGIECACGQRGCFEMYCSARSFGRLYSEALGLDPLGEDAKNSYDLFKALDTDPVARQVWSMGTRYLAHAILMLATISGPTKVVLGGGLSAAGETLTSAVTAHFDAISKIFETPEIVVAELGQRAGILGVALQTIEASAQLHTEPPATV